MPAPVDNVLQDLDRQELQRLAKAAEHLLGGRPAPEYGARARRLRSGLGAEFLDYRDYRPGDELRRVDWRASARSARPVVRRHIEETRSDWMVCVDASASMAAGGLTGSASTWCHGVLLAAAYSHVLLHLGHRVGLVLYSDAPMKVLAAGRGHQQLAKILRLLADARPVARGRDSLPTVCTAHLASADAALLISDLLPAARHIEALKTLRGHCFELHALHLVGDCAAEVPGEGAARLVDVETGDALAVMRSQRLRDASVVQLRAQTDSVDAACRRLGILYSACPIERRWSKNVAAHLSALVRRRA